MMTVLTALLARWGVPESLRKVGAWIWLALAAFVLWQAVGALWTGWLRSHDRAVIRAHEQQIELDVLKRVAAAEAAARTAHGKSIDRTRTIENNAMEAAHDAAQNNRDPVGAYFDSVRAEADQAGRAAR